ncbi:uncharacterized protein L203_100025 [Cryptococcus depauperatus CBS 7841]|uniref:Uncharacterized protein n=1 Tax=Cryptococcus depauperatus CBS 7841 TaxID=1295531 RepID=A0A1E3J000_9TREE|nr:hypothetical protein L203_00318 [Cryptococcus depauperatus CBS 7841]
MCRAIEVTYSLCPPSSTLIPVSSSDPAPSSSAFSFPISPNPYSNLSATTKYYTAASTSLLYAQAALNTELTLWKDAIGDGEKEKEDVGTVGYGRGKANLMSAKLTKEQESSEEDSEE